MQWKLPKNRVHRKEAKKKTRNSQIYIYIYIYRLYLHADNPLWAIGTINTALYTLERSNI